jgi:hypothetical protein
MHCRLNVGGTAIVHGIEWLPLVVYVRGVTCELVIFHEASHGGAESDRMSALRLRVARKVSFNIHDAAAGHTLNEALWGCFRCLGLWKKPLMP